MRKAETIDIYSVVSGDKVLHRTTNPDTARGYRNAWNKGRKGLPGIKPARVVKQKARLIA